MRRRKRYPTRTDYLVPLLVAAFTGFTEVTGISALAKRFMKKRKPKQLKKHEPVRIVNPGDAATARVHPRQGVKIVLDSPVSRHSHVSPDATYEVKIKGSEFLFLERVEQNEKGQDVYYFQQKYDLSDWVQISEVFLGEIVIDLVGNTHETKDQCQFVESTIGVYHKLYDTYSDFLVAVNPDATTIKLEPNRTLEVVLFEPTWEETEFSNETWKVSIEDYEVESKGVFLKEIKHSSFNVRLKENNPNVDKVDGYPILLRHKPAINCVLPPVWKEQWASEAVNKKIPGKQTHFWFAFTDKSIKEMSGMKNGNYVVCRITLTGQNKTNSSMEVVKREFIVMLHKHGKPVGRAMQTTQRTSLPALLYGTNSSSPLKRDFIKHLDDKPNNPISVFTNPGSTENIDFHIGYGKVIVELAVPKAHWPDEPDDALWELKNVTTPTSTNEQLLDVETLPVIEKFGVRYQRYKISRKLGSATGPLGTVELEYPQKKHLPNGSRRLSCWMEFKQKPTSAIYSGSTGSSCNYSGCAGGTHYKTGVGPYQTPKLSGVLIEEIACLTLDDLSKGEKTRKLSDVSNYSGWDGYYYGYNYESVMSSVADAKKKEQPQRLLPPTSPNPGLLRTITGTSTTTATTAITPVNGQLIIHNPAHMEEIVLGVGQELVLMLSQPEFVLTKKEDQDKSRGELWGVNPLTIAGVRPKVVTHKVHPAGSTQFRQEVVIEISTETLPAHKGKVSAGALSLTCSSTNRIIRISVNKQLDTSIEPVYHNTEFLSEIVFHEANKRRHMLIKDWSHGSNLLIKQSDVIYVNAPTDMPDGWDDWGIQFVPEAIPSNLWWKFPDAVKNNVNQANPWFVDDAPLFQNNTLFFRPTEHMSQNFKPLMEAIRNHTKENYLHIATAIFRSHKVEEIEDAKSLVETSVKVRRDLLIYLEIDRTRPMQQGFTKTKTASHNSVWLSTGKIVPVNNPANGAVISAELGEEIHFQLPLRRSDDNNASYVWICSEHPTLLYSLGTSANGLDDVFKFRSKYAGEGHIVFKNPKEEKKIRVKISPKKS